MDWKVAGGRARKPLRDREAGASVRKQLGKRRRNGAMARRRREPSGLPAQKNSDEKWSRGRRYPEEVQRGAAGAREKNEPRTRRR